VNSITTDRQINRLVYDLYGLTEEEIAIVEAATNSRGGGLQSAATIGVQIIGLLTLRPGLHAGTRLLNE
jgi:hypothetical protein